ncbi:hypothetical protein L195_g004791, partial [Trifolium pratense]
WKNRNSSVWNNVKEPGLSLGTKAMNIWSDWKAVQTNRYNMTEVHEQVQQQTEQWKKSRQGWYKCNVDAGFHESLV